MRFLATVLLLCGVGISPAFAALTPAEVKDYLDKKPDPPEWRPERAQVVRILNAELPTGGVTAAQSKLAAQWGIAPDVAAAVIEAVTLEELLYREGRQERAKRITAALTTALAAAPDSANVWALRIEDLKDRNACERESLADEYFKRPWASK